MACKCAPALIALRDQLNHQFPGRNIASDGCCGDPAHRRRKSDHNPTDGYAHAYDITQDPVMGVDCNRLAPQLLADARTKYVIWNGRIGYPSTGWKTYTGTNPHTLHCHVSIRPDARHVTAAWPLTAPPSPVPQEADVPILFKKAGEPAVYVMTPRGPKPVPSATARDQLLDGDVVELPAATFDEWMQP